MAFDGTHYMISASPQADLPKDIKWESVRTEVISDGEGWALSVRWNNLGSPYDNIDFGKVSRACRVSSGPWRYNTAARKWEKAEVLKPGEGYFVKIASDCTLGISEQPKPTLDPLNETYCVQDSDCVRQQSCCDCGLGKYVNRNYAQEVSCTSPRCMCATRESKGACVDNQCKAVAVVSN